MDQPLLVRRPNHPHLYVLSQDRLWEVVPDGKQTSPKVLRTFNGTVLDITMHPKEDRIAWTQANPNERPDLIVGDLSEPNGTNLGTGYDPEWTTSGKHLIYTGFNQEWFIGIREGNKTRRVNVPYHQEACLFPSPSPDSKLIGYSMRGEDGTMQIGLLAADGTTRQLTHLGNHNTKLSFSPDGCYIAFIRGLRAPCVLVVKCLATGKETVLATDAQWTRPVWRTVESKPSSEVSLPNSK